MFNSLRRPLRRTPARSREDSFKQLLQRLAQVLQEVPAVRHLYCRGRAFGDAAGVSLRAVPGDNLDAGMHSEPRAQCFRFTIRQEINRKALLQVDEKRAVSQTTAEGEVVNPDDARG